MLNINRLNNSIDVGDDDMEQSLNGEYKHHI
jgi:hypothetical protein